MNIQQPQPSFYFYLGGGLIFLVVAILFKPFTVINAGERGVVMHFGEVQDQILNEGFHAVLPIYTNVKKMSVRVKKADVNVKVGTKDLQTLDVVVAVNWHVEANRVNRVYQQIGDDRQVREAIVIPAISEVVKASTPQRTAEEILKQRSSLKEEIERNLRPRLVKYGLQVDDVSLINIGFSPEFTKSILQGEATPTSKNKLPSKMLKKPKMKP
jgi:prohibitin 1